MFAAPVSIPWRGGSRPVCGKSLERWLPDDPGILPKAGRLLDDVEAFVSRRCRPEEGRHVLILHNDGEDALEANALKIADKVQQLVISSPASGGSETSKAHGSISGRTTRDRSTAWGKGEPQPCTGRAEIVPRPLGMFLVLVPFYLLGKTPVPQTLNSLAANKAELSEKVEGGVPQPADYVMASIMVALLAGGGYGVSPKHFTAVRVFACFVAYAGMVNMAWSCLTLNHSIMLNTVYYVYGFAVLLVFLTLHAQFGERLLRLTFHGIAVSLLIQAVLSPVARIRAPVRRTLFFNNPNQLGYYAIVGASTMYLGSRHMQFSGWYKGCVYTAAVYLVILSLSKTATLALAILRPSGFARPAAGSPGGAAPFGVYVGSGSQHTARLYCPGPHSQPPGSRQHAQSGRDVCRPGLRSHRKPSRVPLFRGRRRGRLSALSLGVHQRTPFELWDPAVLLWPGRQLPVYLGPFFAVPGADWQSVLCLVPVFFFGLAHQGLRFNLFWVLLGTIACVGKAPRVTAAERVVAQLRVQGSSLQLSSVR